MPLQIRRGTTAERLSIVPLPGEPILDTDLNTIFIGNGTTAGGISAITGITSEDAMDIVGQMFLNGQHEGITFTYGSTQDVANRIDARIDLSNYDGEVSASALRGTLFANDSSLIIDSNTKNIIANDIIATSLSVPNISADLKGSLFGDDSTLLVNAIDNSINLDGTVKGAIVPDLNEVYDLGSPSNRFKDLYLSGTSLFLGSAQITANGSAIELPVGSTVAGIPIGTGSGTGDGVIEGNNYKINIVADNSTVMVNGATGDIVATNFTATGPATLEDSLIVSGGNLSVIGDNAIRGLAISAYIDNDQGPNLSFLKTRGSLASPTANNSGDRLGNFLFRGHTQSAEQTAAAITSTVEATPSLFACPANLEFQVRNGLGTLLSPLKILNSGIIQIRSDSNLTSNKIILTSCHHDSSATTTGLGLSRSRGTIASPSAIQTGDMIYNITWGAYSGTTYRDAAIIRAVVDGTVSSTTVPGRIEFWTSNASGTMTKNAQIDKDGVLKVDRIQALNSTLTITADIIGSIYSDASTMIIDGTDGSIKYYPSTPADWAGTPPTTIGEAIDRLAARLKLIDGGVGA